MAKALVIAVLAVAVAADLSAEEQVGAGGRGHVAGDSAAAATGSPAFWPRFGGSREVRSLDGMWDYGLHLDPAFDSADPAFDPGAPGLAPNSTRVPSTMDAAPPGISGPRGVAIYRTRFEQRGAARLQLMACSFYCRVFVDGAELGDHRAGGYVPFVLDVPASAGEDLDKPKLRELVVLADNRFNATLAPMHTGGDFWHFGGLMRSVLLHKMPDARGEVWPWRAYVFPQCLRSGTVSVNVSLSDGSFSGEVLYNLAFDAANNGAADVPSGVSGRATAVGGMVVLRNVRVPNPKLWTLSDPQMHTLTVTIGGASVIERFGLRSWGVDPKSARITLNGEVVHLHGWNHHTQWPDKDSVTASPTDAQIDEDIELLVDGGANYVRGGHYPQDQRWLDRLDEHGFAMWEETLGPNVKVDNLQDWKHFMRFQLQQMDEMILQSLNHPSIMTWGFFNEGPSRDSKSCPGYAACADRARGLDSTRFVTWASNTLLGDKCLEHATLISFNTYPAWYYNKSDLTAPAKIWNRYANAVRQAHPRVPFVISETGAGGVYEWASNDTDARWTQLYQAEVLAADVDVALGNPNISGVTLWHFFDFKINDEDTKGSGPCELEPGIFPPVCRYVNVDCNRPKGVNNKGVVDFWRRKKLAYHVVAAKYKADGGAQGVPLASPLNRSMTFLV